MKMASPTKSKAISMQAVTFILVGLMVLIPLLLPSSLSVLAQFIFLGLLIAVQFKLKSLSNGVLYFIVLAFGAMLGLWFMSV